MIVLVHANYFTLGAVSSNDIISNPFSSFVRMLFEQICIVGVDVFVLISGWFGIKPTLKGGGNILFQVLFYMIIILIVALVLNIEIPQGYVKLRGYGGYWFVPVYVFLYVFAPVLNSFVASSQPRTFLLVLLLFFLFETYYVYCGEDPVKFANGYSLIHFIGLYLLAQFVRKCFDKIRSCGAIKYFGAYVLFTLIPSLMAFVGLKHRGVDFNAFAYSSPFVVAASLSLLLAFDRIKLKSKIINWVACSVFAIYLIHMNPIVVPYFLNLMRWGYASFGAGWYILFALFVAIGGGMLCVLIDKIRVASWNYSYKRWFKSLFGYIEKMYDRFCMRLVQ